MNEIRVNVPDAYSVYIGKGILDNSTDILKSCGISGKTVIVCDSNVAPLYLERFEKILRDGGFEASHFIFPAGEKSKTIDTLSDILEAFAKSGMTRKDTAIALGGGVTGDHVSLPWTQL